MWKDWEKGKHDGRSQSKEDLEFFPCADCSKCLKFVFLAGCLLEVRSSVATVSLAVRKSSINFFQSKEAFLTLLQLFLTPL